MTPHDFENVVLFNRIFKNKNQAVTDQAFDFKRCFGTHFLMSPQTGVDASPLFSPALPCPNPPARSLNCSKQDQCADTLLAHSVPMCFPAQRFITVLYFQLLLSGEERSACLLSASHPVTLFVLFLFSNSILLGQARKKCIRGLEAGTYIFLR